MAADRALNRRTRATQVGVDDFIASVLTWISENSVEMSSEAVPGATAEQLGQLGALGGVVGTMVPDSIRSAAPEAVKSWLERVQPPPDLTIGWRRARTSPDELLAELYCAILPPSGRRVLGTFFTPPAVVGQMLDIATGLLPAAPAVVVDPGAGVGAFTGAALKRWRACEVHAVDVNVVTLGLLAAYTSALTDAAQRRLTIHQADYLSWVREERPDTKGSVLTLGNPPYTRHQLLTSRQKDAGLAAAGSLLDNRNSTLAGYMVAATLGRLRPSDAMVLLIPANWLHANYARVMREWLWRRSPREVEVRLLEERGLFPDANIAASILAVGPARSRPQALKLSLGHIDRLAGPDERDRPPPEDWRAYLRRDPGGRGSLTLGDVCRVRRGAATGDNKFFIVDKDLASLINSKWVVRAAGRLHQLQGEVLDEAAHDALSESGARCWFLRLPRDADIRPLKWYLELGEERGVPHRTLARARPVWWSVEQLAAPTLLLQPMTKTRFRVVSNEVRAFHTNTLYGIYPRGLSSDSVGRLAEWLRGDEGQAALRRIARPLSSGLLRVEPRALSSLLLPPELALEVVR